MDSSIGNFHSVRAKIGREVSNTMHSICAKIGNADDRDDDREPTNANEAIDKGLPPTNEEDVKMEQ